MFYVVPKYGRPFFRAHAAAWIFPSVPLEPKPPGTRTPLKKDKKEYYVTICFMAWRIACREV